jgi:hypothetical protein
MTMKTITVSWVVALALVAGCSAAVGAEDGTGGNGGIDGPASDTLNDKPKAGNTSYTPSNTMMPPNWEMQTPTDLIPVKPLVPDPEADSGPTGEEGSPPPAGGEQTPVVIDPVLPPPAVYEGPTVVDGNPTCADVFNGGNAYELDVTRLKDGTFTSADGTFSVTIDFNGNKISYTSSGGTILGVIVKGGPHANFYQQCTATGTDLTTVAGEDISHIVFCWAPAG